MAARYRSVIPGYSTTILLVLLTLGLQCSGIHKTDPGPKKPAQPMSSSKPDCPNPSNLHVAETEVEVKPLPLSPNDYKTATPATSGSHKGNEGYSHHQPSVNSNCTRKDAVEISMVVPVDGDSWKTKVIIACTVAAAVEVVIVIVMVMYWKQIRWTLRKFTCPCEERSARRGHEAMERTDNEGPDVTFQPVEGDLEVMDEGHQVQTFSGPSTSRHGIEDEADLREEISSV